MIYLTSFVNRFEFLLNIKSENLFKKSHFNQNQRFKKLFSKNFLFIYRAFTSSSKLSPIEFSSIKIQKVRRAKNFDLFFRDNQIHFSNFSDFKKNEELPNASNFSDVSLLKTTNRKMSIDFSNLYVNLIRQIQKNFQEILLLTSFNYMNTKYKDEGFTFRHRLLIFEKIQKVFQSNMYYFYQFQFFPQTKIYLKTLSEAPHTVFNLSTCFGEILSTPISETISNTRVTHWVKEDIRWHKTVQEIQSLIDLPAFLKTWCFERTLFKQKNFLCNWSKILGIKMNPLQLTAIGLNINSLNIESLISILIFNQKVFLFSPKFSRIWKTLKKFSGDWKIFNQYVHIKKENRLIGHTFFFLNSKHPGFELFGYDFFQSLNPRFYLNCNKSQRLNCQNFPENGKKLTSVSSFTSFVTPNKLKKFLYIQKVPSYLSLKEYLKFLKMTIQKCYGESQHKLISKLSILIENWKFYFMWSSNSQKHHFCDFILFKFLWRWACRRHSKKSRQWIKQKYFQILSTNQWLFGFFDPQKSVVISLPTHRMIRYNKH